MTSTFTPEPNAFDKIEAILNILEEELTKNDKALKEQANAEADYKVAYAQAYMRASQNPDLKTVDAKNSQAVLDCEQQLKDRLMTTAVMEGQKQRMRFIQAELSSYQTLANASRGV
jgi:hypothetical protein